MNSWTSPISHKELKKEAIRVLDGLPAQFRRRLHNVVVAVEKRPKPSQFRAMGLDPREDTLYGLYEGIPFSERSTFDPHTETEQSFSPPVTPIFPAPAAGSSASY